jgi:hypothetical protein
MGLMSEIHSWQFQRLQLRHRLRCYLPFQPDKGGLPCEFLSHLGHGTLEDASQLYGHRVWSVYLTWMYIDGWHDNTGGQHSAAAVQDAPAFWPQRNRERILPRRLGL